MWQSTCARVQLTLLQWHAEVLSASNGRALLIPRGFAHGFQALSQDCELLYLHSSAYAPQAEGALNVRDPRLAIAWPRADQRTLAARCGSPAAGQ